ncbi:hypothetical protein [Curtobacterium sp. ME26]|uniref:hypothetical protein n=1 Tax=Curtobacterium sp. ME26 TaxID=2744254 RepID=UPI0015F71E64|nr:hypothetical protein [Curtobacterium sp. ME26]
MSLAVARSCLVGTAGALVLVGVVADLPGSGRAALLVAGGWCALLDLLVVRSDRRTSTGPPVVLVDPVTAPSEGSGVRDHGGSVPDPNPAPGPGILLGRRDDGHLVRVATDPTAPCHVVVVGTGALAEGMFTAVRAQLDGGATTGSPPDDVVRASGAGVPGPPSTPLPPGTAVAVRLDGGGRPRTTVVLVPGLHLLPRRWDHLVEVTRHGCRTQDNDDGGSTTIDPVLPLLVPGSTTP